MPRIRTIAMALCALALGVAALAAPGSATAATWVIKGHGFGHGVGMGQWGAYGYAKHGRAYRWILGHYYRHTKVGKTKDRKIRVLLDSGGGSVSFGKATRACGHTLNRHRAYRFDQSGSSVILRSKTGRRIASCGRSGTASGAGGIRISGKSYRGDLKAKASGGLLVINVVRLDAYAKGVVPNEVPASWPQAALRAQAVAARSYALASRRSGSFDVYNDTRSQVYGGKSSEAGRTNSAVEKTSDRIVRYRGKVALTYFSSSTGGQSESVQFGFPGASPVPYLKSVNDRYDTASPDHNWHFHLSQGTIESRLSGLFSGRLKKIRVLKRGDSPRIVRAKVVGSRGSSRVTGPTLQARLGTKSTWMRFIKR